VTNPQHIIADTRVTLDRLGGALVGLSDDDLAAPSPLPGWTRGHVLAHIDGVGNGLARQVEYVAIGDTIEMYDGGQEGRDAAIAAAAGRSAASHQSALHDVGARLASAWATTSDWDAPVRYRFGTVAGVLHAWWRELGIHAVDADIGIDQGSWGPDLCGHLTRFLAERLPGPATVRFSDTGWSFEHGDPGSAGEPPEVAGRSTDVAAWLAGRVPEVRPTATAGGGPVDLPPLGPWPPPSARF